ncbi:methyl-accepting chemotaxis protein [Geomonas sp. Red32]|uniref:methyl-accepting chemotaxis protein n=1 Tax=Geomonas sp. Red32 TaxID=2912856 RepID=UPI00202CCBC2|nr:HAMP domain-containing methyl-accepting chemotaxis protein [Geomonas sp. Red32]MCM0080975.1 methyl-accepting chemotaxis protein [Geomonas sp. Red32]
MKQGLSIRRKLFIGVGIIILTVVGVAGTAIYSISLLNRNIDTLTGTRVPQLLRAAAITEAIHTSAIHIDEAILSGDPETAKKELEITTRNRKATNENMDKLKDSMASEKEKAMFQTVLDNRTPYVKGRDSVIALVREGKNAEAVRALDAVKPMRRAFLDALKDLAVQVQDQSAEAGRTARNNARTALAVVVTLSVAVVIVAALIFVWIVKSVSMPLKMAVDTANRIAEKDLSVAIEQGDLTETGQLMSAMANMAHNLSEIVAQASRISTGIASSSAQLQATSQEMAGGSEEAAGQTHSVVTATEQMAATATDIARNCHAAAKNSDEANATARTGTKVVADTVEVMNRIAERVRSTADTVENLGARSDQIGEIICTIEDIADQTNLLALNAAIEAARAGEQGRGFAVVADEVRALAERTTKATREIGEMIKTIQAETKGAVAAMEEGVREVHQGTQAAAKSGDALKEILFQIDKVSQQVNQIAIAAEEQTATVEEISANTNRISSAVRSTADGSRHSAQAASQLATMAEELNGVVRQFRISG